MKRTIPISSGMRKGSGCQQELFTEKALDEIYHSSTGIPRLMNRICEKALMYAFQQNRRLIDDHTIRYITEHEMLEACE